MSAERLLATYRRMLRALPESFRTEYGDDMLQLLGDQLRGRTATQQAAIFASAVADLARSVPRERLDERPVTVPALAGAVPAQLAFLRRQTSPSRRDFLRGALIVTGAGLGSAMAGSSLAFLWPNVSGGFGALVDIGTPGEVADGVKATGGTWPAPAARAYIVAYDPADDPSGMYADITGGTGFMALYQRCVHLGCRVPWCVSSTRFECPCHKSRYNRWGEYQDGPAPRGLDRFAVAVVDGRVTVDTRTSYTGPPRAGGALKEGPTGPSCLAAS